MNVRGLGPYGWMLCGSLSFSFMAVLSHAASDYCDWQIVVLARAGLVMLFAAAVAYVHGVKFVVWGPPILWLRSLAGSCSMMLTFYALTRPHVPAGYVLTLTNLFPIWVALLSWPMLGEAPPLAVWLAVVSGVAGVALIQNPDLPEGTIATWMALGASLSSAVAMLGLHQLRGIDPLAIVVHFSAVATVTGLVCFFAFEQPRPAAAVLAWQPLLLLLGIGLTALIGQWFLTLAFTGGSPSRVSVIGLSQVVFVVLMEVCAGAPVTPASVAGTLLILVPTGWIMLQRRPPAVVADTPAIVTVAVVDPPADGFTDISPPDPVEPAANGSKKDTPDEARRALPPQSASGPVPHP